MKKKKRLDIFLHENSFSTSIEKAKKEIVTGWVKVNGETIRDPFAQIFGNEEIIISRPGGNYVSRGGLKLEHALKVFNISVDGMIAADLGSSTGGFTDCLLQNGASKIYAVDNGYGVLAYELRTDSRVIIKERTNVRLLKPDNFDDKIEFVTVDLSFISILKIINLIKTLFTPVSGIILIKPQFEAEKHEHEKGVVRKSNDHINILNRILNEFIYCGFIINGLHYSPIKGPAGNIEFLLYFSLNEHIKERTEILKIDINGIVKNAHIVLNK